MVEGPFVNISPEVVSDLERKIEILQLAEANATAGKHSAELSIDRLRDRNADLQRQLAEAREYGKQARLRENAAEDARIHEQLRASKAEAERDRLAAENEALREALDDMLFEYGDKYDSEGRLKNASELDIIAKARAALDTAKGAEG